MAAKTKRGSIPSLKIDKDFLKDLGSILESETKQRNYKAIKDNDSQYESPRIRLNYSIYTQNEDLTFSSIEEVIDTKFFPNDIERFTCRVSHYDTDEYVDAFISFSKRSFSLAEYELSSTSDERLLKIEDDLKKLFKSNYTEYKSILYPSEKRVSLLPLFILVTVI